LFFDASDLTPQGYEGKYNGDDETPSKYAGQSYGGLGGNHGPSDPWHKPEGAHATEFQPDLETVNRIKRENRAARQQGGGSVFYLDDDEEPSAQGEQQFGPVKNLLDDVPLTAQEKRSFQAGPRGRKVVQRNQKPRAQVTIIEEDENPEGWEEQPKAAEKAVEKDKLSSIIIDASAGREQLPVRKHHQAVQYVQCLFIVCWFGCFFFFCGSSFVIALLLSSVHT
jgi:hypothetical protein